MVATNTETESLEDALQIVKKEKWKLLLVSFEPGTFFPRKIKKKRMLIVSFEPGIYELFIYFKGSKWDEKKFRKRKSKCW